MKKYFMFHIRKISACSGHYRRLLQDYLGAFLVRNWKKIDNDDIVSVNTEALNDVFRIYNNNFNTNSNQMIRRYSSIFSDIFYIAKSENIIVGYCIYYLKPILTLKGLKKNSVIYSIAIDKNYRKKGMGKKLLDISIAEMRQNNICSVCLYVNKENLGAINLYKSEKFKIVGKVKNICGEGKDCYKMELKLIDQ